jgi:D-alanine-D-alanine ligase
MVIAVLFDTPYRGYGPEDHERQCAQDLANPKVEPDMEYQVGDALRRRGHEVTFLGIRDDVDDAMAWLRQHEVDAVFNASESFRGNDSLDYLVPALLESENITFTGAPPQSLMVTRNKAISKKILRHHELSVAAFRTYRAGEKVDCDPGLRYPLIVKPLAADASAGIAQASIVHDVEQLSARVDFVLERFGSAIVEEFIEGRELYVSMIGNGDGVRLLPILELIFDKSSTAPEERIATVKAKWDDEYRARKGIKMHLARPLSQKALERIEKTCRIAYRVLGLRDYARVDLRVDGDDNVWVLEANANPYLNRDHEIAMAAEKGGMSYEDLIETIALEAIARGRGASDGGPPASPG